MHTEVAEPYWIVVKTQSRRERWAQQNVQAQKHETYLPYCEHQGKRQPLFMGYLFVLIKQQWWFLKGTFGVLYPLMHIGTDDTGRTCLVPERIRDTVIHRLREREAHGIVKLPEPEWHKQLELTRGPMQGLFGLYEGMVAKDRVRVLLEFLGLQRTITVPRTHVKGL
jgi:transcriptional antiterminator RfaH